MIRATGSRFPSVWLRPMAFAAAVLLGASPTIVVAQVRATTVIGLDYAFQAPDTLPAGPTTFSFVNRGSVRHEALLFLLNESVSPAEFLRSTMEQRLSLGRPLGAIFAQPGQPAGAQLVGDLERGRTYLLRCVIRDAPDKPPRGAWDGEGCHRQVTRHLTGMMPLQLNETLGSDTPELVADGVSTHHRPVDHAGGG